MPRLTRRHFAATLSATALAAARKPNIIFLLADDLGVGDLGCYGQKILKTPNIDRLAAEGTRFTAAYAGAMVCAPARCSLMTGYHMGHATVRNNWEIFPEGQAPLAARDVTVAQILKQAGYKTGICGKWGLGGPGTGSTPIDKGFDFFYGYNCQRHAHRFYVDYLWRNSNKEPIAQSPSNRIYAQDLIANESLAFIRQNQHQPFFLFCAWTVPHGPYTLHNVPDTAKYQDPAWKDTEKVYATMVDRLDADVGRVLALLKELNLDNNTLVLFASDNGPGGGPVNNARFGSQMGLREVKGTLREGGLRVPFLARWPGKVPAGKVSGFPTAFWDFLPTAASIAGVKAPNGIDGISILPTLQGRQQKPHPYLYWEQLTPAKLSRAVRLGNWKAFQATKSAPIELFNLATDPAETTDVAAAHPEIVRRIEQILQTARTEAEPRSPDPRIWEKYKLDNARLDALLGFSEPKSR
jgi:arylsulfatase A-like enzyme